MVPKSVVTESAKIYNQNKEITKDYMRNIYKVNVLSDSSSLLNKIILDTANTPRNLLALLNIIYNKCVDLYDLLSDCYFDDDVIVKIGLLKEANKMCKKIANQLRIIQINGIVSNDKFITHCVNINSINTQVLNWINSLNSVKSIN